MEWTIFGNKAGKSGFGEGLRDAGKKDNNIVALGADITASVGMNLFSEAFPKRFFSMGIAEQNIAAAATGLYLSGKKPVFSTYGVFAAHRAHDQIRVSICYNKAKVLIGGAHAGLSVGPDGATHQALEDIAIMRVLPNMTVISPADANQCQLAVMNALETMDGPVYIRFGREPMPNFTPINADFSIGKADILIEGKDVTIIATGHLVWISIQAAKELEKFGIEAEVINLHTIKPIDKKTLIDSARKTRAVITAEEHQIAGGMGSAVAEVLSQNCPVPMKIIGIDDQFGESGHAEELLEKYGLSVTRIATEAKNLYLNKNNFLGTNR